MSHGIRRAARIDYRRDVSTICTKPKIVVSIVGDKG
ncbi:hypothetical protein HMPREF1527_01243 [Atopobium sp. oral taxon 199 str. F0494]|nr:hypothetical protein HMPREF1527_01243 [Atopobium sp. oral taxon 199 str. F0494]